MYEAAASKTNGGFSPLSADWTSIQFNDDGPQQFQRPDAYEIKEGPLQSGDLDSLHLFLNNDVTPIGAQTTDIAPNSYGTESFGSKNDKIASSNEKTFLNDGTDFQNQNAPTKCECDLTTLTEYLAQFRAPDLTFKPSQAGDPPQTFVITDINKTGDECGLHELSTFCVAIEFKFFISETDEEISQFPYRGLFWEKQALQLTLNPSSDADLGDHSVTLIILLQSHPTVKQAIKINFNILPTSKTNGRQLGVSGYCTGPTTNLNLLNTNVLVSQSGYKYGFNSNANQGCDGIIQQYNPTQSNTKVVQIDESSNSSQLWWTAEFLASVFVQSVLIFEVDMSLGIVYIRLGDDNTNDFINNPACISGMIQGGWYTCGKTGKYFSLSASVSAARNNFQFIEIMAYSQEAIHIKAVSAKLSSDSIQLQYYMCTTGTNCKASNVLRSTLTTTNINVNCCIYSDVQDYPQLDIYLKAEVLIDAVILLPSDQNGSEATTQQRNIFIEVYTKASQRWRSDILNDFNTYKEVKCGVNGILVIVQRSGVGVTLAMAGVSILSSCDCSKTSFNNKLISGGQPLSQITTVNTVSTAAIVSIQINKQMPDTVSSVCGSADGFSKCGIERVLLFKDKMTSQLISFPFKGFKFNHVTNVLTVDPAQADETFVITVTLQAKFVPTITHSIDITVIVQGGIPPPTPVVLPSDLAPNPVLVVAPPVFVPAAYPPLQISTITYNAIINQQANLQLPKIEASYAYSITSKPTFAALIDGILLLVLSTNEKDLGTQYLDLAAISPTHKVTFKVKIIFASTSTKTSTTTSTDSVSAVTTSTVPVSAVTATQANAVSVSTLPVSAVLTTSVSESATPPVSSQSSETIEESQSLLVSQLEKVECDDDDVCVDPTNSRFSCYFDEETNKMRCGVDLVRKPTASVKSKVPYDLYAILPPTMTVSEIDSKGFFTIKWNQQMNVQPLINKEYAHQILESIGTNSTNATGPNKYLLSAKHIKITIKPNSDQDSSKLLFDWVVINITETQIKMQVIFKNPTFISQDSSSPDYLRIKFLSGFLAVKSKATNMVIVNPLRTEKKKLPTQLVLGVVTETVEEAAVTVKTASQAVIIGNFILSVFLSGALGSMYLMINSFQMMMSYSYLTVLMPANVTLVSVQINTIASFDYLPTDNLFGYLFDFTETWMPFASFEAMGVSSLRLTLYLGTVFFVMVFLFVLSFLFLISWYCKTRFSLVLRFHKMMRVKYYWRGMIRLFLETFFDMCVGVMLSWREPHFNNVSDVFDFILTCTISFILIGGTITLYLLLRKHANQYSGEIFQSNYGSMTEGYFTTGVLGQEATRQMILWFLLRRFLTAVAIVYLGDQSPVWQIAILMYLSLADVLINFNLNAFESKTKSVVAKFNDIIVFLLSYFPFVYSGLVHNPEDRYSIGWFQNSMVGLMFLVNVSAVIRSAIISMMQESRRVKVEQFNFQTLKGMGYVVVIVVETIWQKLARACQIDWVFFDSRPERLNVQIAPQVEKCRHQYAEDLVDQLDELEFYKDNKDAVQIAVQDSLVANEQMRLVQELPGNNQMRPSYPFEQSPDRELGVTFGKPTTTTSGFIQRLTKQKIISILGDTEVPKQPVFEEMKTEFAAPVDESAAQRVKRKWLGDMGKTRPNQVTEQFEFNAGPSKNFKRRPKKQIFVPQEIQLVSPREESKVQQPDVVSLQNQDNFMRQAKEYQVRLCLEKMKANKQQMPIPFTAFVDLLPQKFVEFTPDVKLAEVRFLFGFLTETESKQQMKFDIDCGIQVQPSDQLTKAQEEKMMVAQVMPAKPMKKQMVLQ